MSRKKKEALIDTALPVDTSTTKVNFKRNNNSKEIDLIKRKISKVNLYLSLVDKPLFQTVPIDDVEQASQIEQEINQFLISRAKAVFDGEMAGTFNSTETAFLKLLSKKGLEKSQPSAESSAVMLEKQAESFMETKEHVSNVIKNKSKSPVKSNRVDTKIVTITDEKGNKKAVEVETQRHVIPPPTVKRLPPPSYEEQMARAFQDVAGMEKMLGSPGSPMVVDSSD